MFEGYLEELRKLAEESKNSIPGGKADGKPISKYDPKQLAMGVKVEMEHTDDPEKAKEIASDHLEEFGDYYTRLKKMEHQAEKEKKANGEEEEGAGRPPTPADKAKILAWLKTHDNPSDEAFHEFAEGLGLNVPKAEAAVYDFAHEKAKQAAAACPGGMIRSKGKGKGLGRGRGKGPIGMPIREKLERLKKASKMSLQRRESLPSKAFAVPESKAKKIGVADEIKGEAKGKYPIHDRTHARNALARVSAHGTPAEQATVRKKVHSRYPDIGKEAHVQDLLTVGDQIGRMMAKEAYTRTLGGLAAGTAVGAGLGALTSEDTSSKGRARSAVIGGLAGGVLGGAIGAISEGGAAQIREKFQQSGALNQAFNRGRADMAVQVATAEQARAAVPSMVQKAWEMGVAWARGGR